MSGDTIFFLPLVHGDEGEIEAMFAFEHALLVRQFEERRWTERSANGKQGQRRLFRLAVLPVQNFYSAPNVQSLIKFKQKKSFWNAWPADCYPTGFNSISPPTRVESPRGLFFHPSSRRFFSFFLIRKKSVDVSTVPTQWACPPRLPKVRSGRV